VTVRATATGFTDGTMTATVVQPGMDVIFLSSSGSAAATANDPFQVRIGVPTSNGQGMSVEQVLRAGAPPLTISIVSTDSSAGRLITSAVPGGAGTVSVVIDPLQSRSPSTVSAGGVEFDFVAQGVTLVVPTATGFITVPSGPPPGFQVVVNP
jgi:hypothetical protein